MSELLTIHGNLLGPQGGTGGVKALRGIAFDQMLAWPATNVMDLQIQLKAWLGPLDRDWVTVQPGERNQVNRRLPGITGNVKFHALPASLWVSGTRSGAPAQLQQTAEITQDGRTPKIFTVALSLPAQPSNLSVALEGGETIWSQAGIRSTETFQLPDLSDHVNAYLERIGGETDDAGLELRFIVETDAPGRVDIVLGAPDFAFLRTLDWRNELDDTIRIDRNYELDFGQVLPVEPPQTPEAPQHLSLSRLSVDVSGEFEPGRLLGSLPTESVSRFITVDSDFSVAQPVRVTRELQGVGVATMLWCDGGTELYAALHAVPNDDDNADAPGEPLAEGLVAVSDPAEGRWIVVQFDQPLTLDAGTIYWVLLKSAAGTMRVGLDPDVGQSAPILNRGGGPFWRLLTQPDPAGSSQPLAHEALVRIVYLPQIDTQSGAIEVRLLERDAQASPLFTQRLRPGPDSVTVSVDLSTKGAKSADLELRSYARGSISLANVIEEYT